MSESPPKDTDEGLAEQTGPDDAKSASTTSSAQMDVDKPGL